MLLIAFSSLSSSCSGNGFAIAIEDLFDVVVVFR